MIIRNDLSISQLHKNIQLQCLDCVESQQDVIQCHGQTTFGPCPLHQYRLKRSSSLRLLRKAIESHCKRCLGVKSIEHEDCYSTFCPLRMTTFEAPNED